MPEEAATGRLECGAIVAHEALELLDGGGHYGLGRDVRGVPMDGRVVVGIKRGGEGTEEVYDGGVEVYAAFF